MPLPSFLQRLRDAGRSVGARVQQPAPSSVSELELVRVKARRRLIGMVVLVGAGIIGFPWLFETQPRPLSEEDVEVVRAGESEQDRDSLRAAAGRVTLASDAGSEREPADISRANLPPTQNASARSDEFDEDESLITTPPVVNQPVTPKPVAKPVQVQPKPEPKTEPKVERKAAPKSDAKSDSKGETKSASSDPDGTRYVVQFGAFSDGITAYEARMKVERLGIKTYTQEIKTADGVRIRVRMGPYTKRAEADKVLASLRKAGLNGAVLTL